MTPRKASRAQTISPRATKVGFLTPVADTYADVHRACVAWLRPRGLMFDRRNEEMNEGKNLFTANK